MAQQFIDSMQRKPCSAVRVSGELVYEISDVRRTEIMWVIEDGSWAISFTRPFLDGLFRSLSRCRAI